MSLTYPKFCAVSHRIRPDQGFTLLELVVAVVIVGILAAIAVPAYTSYIKKSNAKAAAADLVALSLNFENTYQRSLQYTAENLTTTSAITTKYTGWSPAQKNMFDFSTTATASTYTLTATGKTSTSSSGCVLTLTEANARTATSACGFTSW